MQTCLSSLSCRSGPLTGVAAGPRSCRAQRRLALRTRASASPGATPPSGDRVRCFVTEDGHMVCERLEPGDYVVETVATSTAGNAESAKREALAAGRSTFCYVLPDGALVCENIPAGEYAIRQAKDDELAELAAHAAALAEGKVPPPQAAVAAPAEGKGLLGKLASIFQ